MKKLLILLTITTICIYCNKKDDPKPSSNIPPVTTTSGVNNQQKDSLFISNLIFEIGKYKGNESYNMFSWVTIKTVTGSFISIKYYLDESKITDSTIIYKKDMVTEKLSNNNRVINNIGISYKKDNFYFAFLCYDKNKNFDYDYTEIIIEVNTIRASDLRLSRIHIR